MRLTDKTCKAVKPESKPYKLSDGGGLYLEVTSTGSKYWRMKYRFLGKEKKLSIGVYPAVTLAAARLARDDAKRMLAKKIDPSSAKQEEKRQMALNAENTFEAIAREWHEHNLEKWSVNHAATIMRRMEMDIFPILGRAPLKDITAPHVLGMVRQVEKRGAHEMARRSVQVCGQVFRYAIVTRPL